VSPGGVATQNTATTLATLLSTINVTSVMLVHRIALSLMR